MTQRRGASCYLRRNRLALAVAFACQGATSDAGDGARRDRASTLAERLKAATFSRTIRAYSAGEHVPCNIIRLRWPIVS